MPIDRNICQPQYNSNKRRSSFVVIWDKGWFVWELGNMTDMILLACYIIKMMTCRKIRKRKSKIKFS